MKYLKWIVKRWELILFILLSVFTLSSTWIAHKGRQRFDWLSEFWADKSGYYVYLPATFFYHWDYDKIPAGIDGKNGYGFVVDHNSRKIYTHFYYGESLLISPFFLAAHLGSKILNRDEEAGFSYPFHRIFNFCAVFYFLLGVWFLKKFLENYFPRKLAWYVVLAVFFGTNLMFYTMEDTLMSHVYSFSMGAVFLFLMKKFIDDPGSYKWFVWMSLVFAVMFVIRPTNSIIGLTYFFFDLKTGKDIWQRVKILFRPKHILLLIIFLIVFSFPQLLYWRYLCGRFTIPPYGGAGFGSWNRPHFLEVWFSTVNGLFTYSPLLLFFVAGMIWMIIRKIPNGIFITIMFLVVSYVAAAWKNWYWGCAFGHRAFVEYYCLFCIPFGFLIKDIYRNKKQIFHVILLFLVQTFIIFSFMLNGSVLLKKNGKCFFGSTWDFGEYSRVLRRALVTWPFKSSQSYSFDYENEEQGRDRQITELNSHSGLYSFKADQQNEYCTKFSRQIWDFGKRYPKEARVSLWVYKQYPFGTGAKVVCSVLKNGNTLYWSGKPVDTPEVTANRWTKIETKFKIPKNLDGDATFLVYVWNPWKRIFYIDDLKVSLRR